MLRYYTATSQASFTLIHGAFESGGQLEDLELVAHAMSPAEIRNTVIRLPF